MEDVLKVGLFVIMMLGAASFFMFTVPVALRRYRQAERDTAPEGGDLEALRAEVDDLRALSPRMAELEERLDFAERLLTQQREDARLKGSPDAAG
jgi:hypothetical protein